MFGEVLVPHAEIWLIQFARLFNGLKCLGVKVSEIKQKKELLKYQNLG